jgi:uncharacterized protein (TIGR02217 family)
MQIEVLADMILPNSVISSGVRGKLKRTNTRIPLGETGRMSINAAGSQALREYELGTVPLRIEAWERVRAFHEITLGGAYGFLIEDPSDNVVAAAASAVSYEPAVFHPEGGGFFTGATHYQLQRRYVDPTSARYSDRPITRPRATGFALYRSGVLVSPSTYTLDATTGQITMTSMSLEDAATLTWAGHFYVPVHFQSDDLDWDLVIAGGYDQRFLAGPSVILQEIRE